jgi:hypothetical protein
MTIEREAMLRERESLTARLTQEGASLKAKDRDRLRSAQEEVRDYEMYVPWPRFDVQVDKDSPCCARCVPAVIRR